MDGPAAKYPIRWMVMHGIHVPHSHCEVCLCSPIICPYTLIPSKEQIINQRLHVHTHVITWVSRNYQRQEYVLSFKHDAERKIERDNEHGPTSVWGRRHCIRIKPICHQHHTYITSLISKVTMPAVKMLPRFTIGWILGMNGRYRRIFTGISSCLFCPLPESTSKYLDDPHLGQYFASSR